MTVVLDETSDAPATESVPADAPAASWLARAGAFALDVLLGIGVIATMALLALAAPQRGWLWWVFTGAAALTVLAMAVNRWVLPAMTGWSLGRALFGIAVRCRDGGDVGSWRLLARDLAHLLDTAALFLGWLWPLWDRRRRTFADLLLRTEVRPVERPSATCGGRLRRCWRLRRWCARPGGAGLSGGVPPGSGGRRRPRPDRRRRVRGSSNRC